MEFAAIVVRPEEWGAEVPVVEGGSCLPIIWPGMGAVERSLHQFRLPAGASTVDLRHPVEAVYYVVEGEVEVTDLDGFPLALALPSAACGYDPILLEGLEPE